MYNYLFRNGYRRATEQSLFFFYFIFLFVCLLLHCLVYRDCNNDVAYNFKKLGHINSMLSLNWFFAFRKFANAYTMHYQSQAQTHKVIADRQWHINIYIKVQHIAEHNVSYRLYGERDRGRGKERGRESQSQRKTNIN